MKFHKHNLPGHTLSFARVLSTNIMKVWGILNTKYLIFITKNGGKVKSGGEAAISESSGWYFFHFHASFFSFDCSGVRGNGDLIFFEHLEKYKMLMILLINNVLRHSGINKTQLRKRWSTKVVLRTRAASWCHDYHIQIASRADQQNSVHTLFCVPDHITTH